MKRIKIAQNDLIKKAIEMNHKAFQASDWITEEDAYLIYHNKMNCLIWLTQDDKPVGIVTISPLSCNVPRKAMVLSTPSR